MSGPAQQTAVASKMTIAFPGMLSNASLRHNVASGVNAEASAQLLFGTMVKKGTGDADCLLMTAAANVLQGVVAHSHAYEKDIEEGASGLNPTATVGLLRHGAIYVLTSEDVDPTSAVRINCDTNLGTTPGSFCKTAVVGHTLNVSSTARWLSSSFSYTPPGGSTVKVGELELDMTGIAGAVAD